MLIRLGCLEREADHVSTMALKADIGRDFVNPIGLFGDRGRSCFNHGLIKADIGRDLANPIGFFHVLQCLRHVNNSIKSHHEILLTVIFSLL